MERSMEHAGARNSIFRSGIDKKVPSKIGSVIIMRGMSYRPCYPHNKWPFLLPGKSSHTQAVIFSSRWFIGWKVDSFPSLVFPAFLLRRFGVRLVNGLLEVAASCKRRETLTRLYAVMGWRTRWNISFKAIRFLSFRDIKS